MTVSVSEISARGPYSADMKQILICLLIASSAPAAGSEDHHSVRAAVQANRILPLSEIIPEIEAQLNARLLEVEFETEHGRYVYELELITKTGRMIEVYVDGATGEILEIEQGGQAEDDD